MTKKHTTLYYKGRNYKEHTLLYYTELGYDIEINEFVPSEISGFKAVDIHHICTRENRIENLIAVTRAEHLEFGEVKRYMYYLLITHRDFLDSKGVQYDNSWFEKYINRYKPEADEN